MQRALTARSMIGDLVHLLRSLRRSPASALAAVVTLALTLGAATTIFAIVDAVLLTPPPFVNPDALVTLGESPVAAQPAVPRMVSYPTFEAWRARARSLATLAGFDPTNATLTGLGAAERVSVTEVEPGFLGVLGVTPVLGRTFVPGDVGQPVVIVSHGFWRGALAADRDVIGRTIMLGGRAHTIVGVLPDGFVFALNPCDVWRPLPLTAAQAARTSYRMRAIARLAAGVSPASLATALDEVSRQSVPASRSVVTPFATAIARGATRTLVLLAASAALAMLIAFTNLAGLLIVRSIDRTHELAVRTALGARRFAIARHLILEAESLVAIGIVAGIVLADWMTPTAGRLALEQFGAIANRDIAVSWRVVGGVAAMAVACALACGLLPTFLASSRLAVDVLSRGVTRSRRQLAFRRALIAGEVAVAFVLLVSMALLARSLVRALDVDPGFRANGVLTMSVSLPAARYVDDAREAAFYTSLQTALDARLGVGTSAIIDEIPLTGDSGRSLVGVRKTDVDGEAIVRAAGTSYFDVMGIPIVGGRALDGRDDASAAPRALVSARLATRLFGGQAAVGREIYLSGPNQSFEIVGVAGDVNHRAIDEAPLETVYLSGWQWPSRSSHIVVRSQRPAADVAAIVREEVGRLDRDMPVYAIRPMTEVVAASPGMPARRVLTATFTAFALLALVLSAVGLFGAVAHDVASRRPELALRLALGANPRRLLTATLRQAATIVTAGVAVGLLLSVWAGELLMNLAPTTERFNVVSAGTAAAVLLIVGVCAALPVARRAARTDPLIALRSW